MLQFEAKTYKNQRKGFTEVTGSFQYKFPDYKSPQDDLLSWLISKKKKKKFPKQLFFFKTHVNLQSNFPCLYPSKTSENLNLWFSDTFRGFKNEIVN